MVEKEVNLKPCPFCGGEKLKVESKRKNISYRHVYVVTKSVRCNRCHARGCTASGEVGNYSFGTPKSDNLKTEQEIEAMAIKAWNKRKPMDRIVEQLEEEKEKIRNTACWLEKEGLMTVSRNHYNRAYAFIHAIEIVKGVQNE